MCDESEHPRSRSIFRSTGSIGWIDGFPRWGDGKFNFKRRPVSIDIDDIAGNALQSLSENEVTVNASIVTITRDANGVYAERSVGADLAGTLMKVTSDGRVSFAEL